MEILRYTFVFLPRERAFGEMMPVVKCTQHFQLQLSSDPMGDVLSVHAFLLRVAPGVSSQQQKKVVMCPISAQEQCFESSGTISSVTDKLSDHVLTCPDSGKSPYAILGKKKKITQHYSLRRESEQNVTATSYIVEAESRRK
ncbi:hypothetical protein MJT46_019129 [Ovis ammon polii x Ovis aries]|nr:hypothetical protein MJT46_019129 [Ovis ammon polii x Ovis aries]